MVKMVGNFKFDYDYDNDNLFMYSGKSKSSGSVEIDDVIVDFNSKKEIVGLELLDASKFFKDLDKSLKLTKKRLSDISECKVEVLPRKSFYMLKLHLVIDSKDRMVAPIYLPSIDSKNPAVMA